MSEGKLFFTLIIFTAFMGMASWGMYQREQIREYRIQIYSYQTQITNLETEAVEQEQRFDAARKQADVEMRHVQDESKKILMAKVPKNCEQAIQWGINAAHTFI